MRVSLIVILVCLAIGVSAGVVEPYGEIRGYHYSNSYQWPGQTRREAGRSDRPVWRLWGHVACIRCNPIALWCGVDI